jgi:micrococcal nuclease
MYEYDAKLERVVDGDTVWLVVDLGFRVSQRLELRLYGIDTPELVGATRTAGLAAKSELLRLCSLGPLRIRTYKAGVTDKYGRWLATLYVSVGGETLEINEQLVRTGFAVRYPG